MLIRPERGPRNRNRHISREAKKRQREGREGVKGAVIHVSHAEMSTKVTSPHS